MDQDRTLVGIADILQHRDQVVEIVAIDRADIIKAQFLEQGAAHRQAARELVGLACGKMERTRQAAGELLGDLAHAQERARGDDLREVGGEAAYRRRDRHVVVVEDHDQPVAGRRGIVHRLIGHAGGHRAVADNGDRLARLVAQLVGDGEAERGRDRGRAVRRAERIILALGTLGEAGEAAALPQRADAGAPAGEDLVGIGLVADVPDQHVARRIEHVMDRNRQLDDAESRSEMAAGDAHGGDHLRAQFAGELTQLIGRESAQLLRRVGTVEERRGGLV